MKDSLTLFLKTLHQYGIETQVPNITETNAKFLHFLLRNKKTETVLEVGTANGYSTIWFADAIAPFDGTITTIERSAPTYKEALSNFEQAGFTENISPLYGDGKVILANWKQNILETQNIEDIPKGPQYLDGSNGLLYKKSIQKIPDTFDVIFLDAQKSQYKVFWDLLLPRMHNDTLIIVDDIGKFAVKTNDFVKHVESSDDFDHVILPIDEDDGIMLIQRKTTLS